MAVQSATVNVTTAATKLSGSETDHSRGQALMLKPPSVIYVGPAGVTTATGYPLEAGAEYFFDLGGGEDLYGVAAAGSVAVPVLRTGV